VLSADSPASLAIPKSSASPPAARRGPRRDDHVLRLHVAMHDATLVRVLERIGEHGADREQLAIADAAGR